MRWSDAWSRCCATVRSHSPSVASVPSPPLTDDDAAAAAGSSPAGSGFNQGDGAEMCVNTSSRPSARHTYRSTRAQLLGYCRQEAVLVFFFFLFFITGTPPPPHQLPRTHPPPSHPPRLNENSPQGRRKNTHIHIWRIY